MADTKFDAPWWNIKAMGRQAREIAKEEGLKRKADLDSFRYGYTTAKLAERYTIREPVEIKIGGQIAGAMGVGNELFGISNTWEDHVADMRNNETGLHILGEVEEEVKKQKAQNNLSDEQAAELRDQLLRSRIADAIRSGQMNQNPLSGDKKTSGNTADQLLSHPYDRK